MKLVPYLNKNIKVFFVLVLVTVFFDFHFDSQMVNAMSMDNFQNASVTEELRLSVPNEFREAWLRAEKNIWEPWLSSKDGFMGREIFWNKEKEEALILVNWENKKLWKSISMQEVYEIQGKFEDNVKESLNLNENPFRLIYEGELEKQL